MARSPPPLTQAFNMSVAPTTSILATTIITDKLHRICELTLAHG